MSGLLVVLSGPSGVGKGTIVRRLLEAEDVVLSVSATTRRPRPGEVDGVHYHFVDATTFDRFIAADDLLEWAEYAGNRYGTPSGAVQRAVDAGRVVVLEIEAQGAGLVRDRAPQAFQIFVSPPDLAELERRLRGRGTEAEDVVAARLDVARWELEQAPTFDAVVVNDDLDRAVAEIRDLISGRR